jgi:hypothetical protein
MRLCVCVCVCVCVCGWVGAECYFPSPSAASLLTVPRPRRTRPWCFLGAMMPASPRWSPRWPARPASTSPSPRSPRCVCVCVCVCVCTLQAHLFLTRLSCCHYPSAHHPNQLAAAALPRDLSASRDLKVQPTGHGYADASSTVSISEEEVRRHRLRGSFRFISLHSFPAARLAPHVRPLPGSTHSQPLF